MVSETLKIQKQILKDEKLIVPSHFSPFLFTDPLGGDRRHWHVVFRSKFHLKLWNSEYRLRLVFVSETDTCSSFFRGNFTRCCHGLWAFSRLIKTAGGGVIRRAYVPPGCTNIVEPILDSASHRWGVPPTTSNFLDDSHVRCEKRWFTSNLSLLNLLRLDNDG